MTLQNKFLKIIILLTCFLSTLISCSIIRHNKEQREHYNAYLAKFESCNSKIIHAMVSYVGRHYAANNSILINDTVGKVIDSLMTAHPSDTLVIMKNFNLAGLATYDDYHVRIGEAAFYFRRNIETDSISKLEVYRPKEWFNGEMYTKGRDIINELLYAAQIDEMKWEAIDNPEGWCINVDYIMFCDGKITNWHSSFGGIPRDVIEYKWL